MLAHFLTGGALFGDRICESFLNQLYKVAATSEHGKDLSKDLTDLVDAFMAMDKERQKFTMQNLVYGKCVDVSQLVTLRALQTKCDKEHVRQ